LGSGNDVDIDVDVDELTDVTGIDELLLSMSPSALRSVPEEQPATTPIMNSEMTPRDLFR
jgi:hypothetical protein